MSRGRFFVVYFALTFMSTFVGCSGRQEKTSLVIAAAANTRFAMEKIIDAYKQQSASKVDMIISSSGKLTAQIENGAPYDVFISADLKYPTRLHKKGLTTGPPVIYAKGSLVLWTTSLEKISIEKLRKSHIEVIAMANPDLAPYGVAAKEALVSYQLWDSLKTKMVYGESVSQANQFILSGNAQAGFTAKSVVLAPKMQHNGSWIEVDRQSYEPILQGAVIIKQANSRSQQAEAQKFLDFMLSPAGQDIFLSFGYQDADE